MEKKLLLNGKKVSNYNFHGIRVIKKKLKYSNNRKIIMKLFGKIINYIKISFPNLLSYCSKKPFIKNLKKKVK